MAKLLPVVEHLEPDRLAERIWLIAASRAPTVQEPTAEDLEGTFALAMRIARYDRAIADVIAAAALERLPDLLGESVGQYNHIVPTILKYLTTYDPRRLRRCFGQLPDAARKPGPNQRHLDGSQHRVSGTPVRGAGPRVTRRGQAQRSRSVRVKSLAWSRWRVIKCVCDEMIVGRSRAEGTSMGIAFSTTVGIPARQRVVRFLGWVLAASSFTVTLLAAQGVSPGPAVCGENDPRAAWPGRALVRPGDEAAQVPGYRDAQFCFEQGVADPRGCEYREVEVGADWIVKAHGFVLPERADAAWPNCHLLGRPGVSRPDRGRTG